MKINNVQVSLWEIFFKLNCLTILRVAIKFRGPSSDLQICTANSWLIQQLDFSDWISVRQLFAIISAWQLSPAAVLAKALINRANSDAHLADLYCCQLIFYRIPLTHTFGGSFGGSVGFRWPLKGLLIQASTDFRWVRSK